MNKKVESPDGKLLTLQKEAAELVKTLDELEMYELLNGCYNCSHRSQCEAPAYVAYQAVLAFQNACKEAGITPKDVDGYTLLVVPDPLSEDPEELFLPAFSLFSQLKDYQLEEALGRCYKCSASQMCSLPMNETYQAILKFQNACKEAGIKPTDVKGNEAGMLPSVPDPHEDEDKSEDDTKSLLSLLLLNARLEALLNSD